ncbi:nucleoside deaminase [Brevibacillus ruminantium]|uniref:Nucleoside deaminase n=1 Tax=Brevibacillus ruminantium TaxID=2950604 RepID=A0ABY4WIH1_9BACL|nr:nucleoside deaminase [Brevibacillus ruminantium]USG66950.1 nucleoside deaminase [Brevibacillus ruminantium]
MNDQKWMQQAIQMACDNVRSGHGSPYGALVVKNGEIIGRGVNEVTATQDPTAHAEILAIREACKHENSPSLEDCVIYASGEPCPMCLTAIYYTGIQTVFYGYSKEEAKPYGFNSGAIYEQIALPMEQRSIQMKKLENDQTVENPLILWQQAKEKQD